MDWKSKLSIETYIQPLGAKQKLEKSESQGQPVYIYGGCGFGKTELLKQYFEGRDDYEMFSAKVVDPKELKERLFPETEKRGAGAGKRIVVIDDLYGIFGNNVRREWREFFKCCREDKDLWLIVSSRSGKIPYYRKEYSNNGLAMITESDLSLSCDQVKKLYQEHGVELTADTMEEAYLRVSGNPLWTFLLLKNLKAVPDVKKAFRRFRMDGWHLLKENVYNTWPKDLLEPIVKLSILNEFDLEAAEEITGAANIKRILDKAEELGNFLVKTGEMYHIRETMRLAMVAQQYRKRKRIKHVWETGRNRRTAQEIRTESAMEKSGINEKELEIIKLMAIGKTNVEIGDGLGVREVTVKYHNMKIFKKLGVKSRIQAIREAQRRGLI